jgi:hypothetical protein
LITTVNLVSFIATAAIAAITHSLKNNISHHPTINLTTFTPAAAIVIIVVRPNRR